MDDGAAEYPAHWEADVVLRDGGTAHIRPIRPSDADALRRFHSRLSERSIYFRFFSLVRELSDRDVRRFTVVDHVDRVALVATVGDELIGVVRYERLDDQTAEVAFSIEDAHQGRGLGAIFLEHIAAAARERGIARFVAYVLPENIRMLRVFEDAGYVVRSSTDQGIRQVEFDLTPTEDSLAVAYAREHRAEARSVQRLLEPRSVAVVGASRGGRSVGSAVLRNLMAAGFTGRVAPVHPAAEQLADLPAWHTVSAVPDGADVVVVAVPADEVAAVVDDSARAGAHALVVMSGHFAETGAADGRERQRQLVQAARGHGMRVVGPASFGVLNTDPAVRLNASLSPVMPPTGNVGFFAQSGALGVALMDMLGQRNLGVSSFVSAGNRVDVSGNDLLQFWEEDERTSAVMLYLESLGNPRKFSRLARRVSRRKPVVVVKAGRGSSHRPEGHLVSPSRAPAGAVEALFRQAGVIRVDSIHQMFDVAQLLAAQPLPAGPRVAIVSNSPALVSLAEGACDEQDLVLARPPRVLESDASGAEFAAALSEAFAAEDVDAVIAQFVPPLYTRDDDVVDELTLAAGRAGKPAVATFLGRYGLRQRSAATGAPGNGTPQRLDVPSYPTPEDAVRALAAVARYATWRAVPAGQTVVPAGLRTKAARELVDRVLGAQAENAAGEPNDGEPRYEGEPNADEPNDGEPNADEPLRGSPGSVVADDATLAELLACYGIDLWPTLPAPTREAAVAAASRLGFPVALKSLAPHLRHRSDLGGVRLHIDDEAELLGAYDAMAARLGPAAESAFAVQRMAPPGVACIVESLEDPLLGPVVSFGIGGVAAELLGDIAYAIPPLTDTELTALVTTVRAAPLLWGHRGAQPVDIDALKDVIARLAHLADDLAEVAELSLNPVLVGASGAAVLSARGRFAPPDPRSTDPRTGRTRRALGHG